MTSDLVDRWIRCHQGGTSRQSPLCEAWEAVDNLVHADWDAGWSLVLQLIDAAPDSRVLAAVAAGPLEDLLVRMPTEYIERVVLQARRDPKLRRCLTGVWGLPPAVRERLPEYVSSVEDPL